MTLGTNSDFACIAFTETRLNTGLTAHFPATFILACLAMYIFYRAVCRLQFGNLAVFRLLYIGRSVAAALFVPIPVAVLHSYATDSSQLHACQHALKK